MIPPPLRSVMCESLKATPQKAPSPHHGRAVARLWLVVLGTRSRGLPVLSQTSGKEVSAVRDLVRRNGHTRRPLEVLIR